RRWWRRSCPRPAQHSPRHAPRKRSVGWAKARRAVPTGAVDGGHAPAALSPPYSVRTSHDHVSPIRRVEREILGDRAFPPVTIREQPLLVVVKLLARLGRELEIRSLDDRIDRTGLLTQAAVDAFDHVDVVARGAAGAVVAARPGLDGDRLRRA